MSVPLASNDSLTMTTDRNSFSTLFELIKGDDGRYSLRSYHQLELAVEPGRRRLTQSLDEQLDAAFEFFQYDRAWCIRVTRQSEPRSNWRYLAPSPSSTSGVVNLIEGSFTCEPGNLWKFDLGNKVSRIEIEWL